MIWITINADVTIRVRTREEAEAIVKHQDKLEDRINRAVPYDIAVTLLDEYSACDEYDNDIDL